jgi:hypothetical protein
MLTRISLVGTHDVVPKNFSRKLTRFSRLVAWNFEGRGMAPRLELKFFHYDTRKTVRPFETWVRRDHCADKLGVDEVCTSVCIGCHSVVKPRGKGKPDLRANIVQDRREL